MQIIACHLISRLIIQPPWGGPGSGAHSLQEILSHPDPPWEMDFSFHTKEHYLVIFLNYLLILNVIICLKIIALFKTSKKWYF